MLLPAPFRRDAQLAVLATLLVAGGVCLFAAARAPSTAESYGVLEAEVKSKFSHIRVRKQGDIRTLMFVRDSGEEVVETSLDLAQPHRLLSDYTRFMFMSYLFQAKPNRVLIIGLGGGAMVHFLKHHDPEAKVDVVEIDPAVVALAEEKFGVRSEGNVSVVTGDGLKFLQETEREYDVIYMDAFLKPSRTTDTTGAPLKLKTARFYRDVQRKLSPEGVMVFNLNPHHAIRDDVVTITNVFPQTYVYRLADSTGLVVIGSKVARRQAGPVLAARAKALDQRFEPTFSFERMAERLAP